FAGLVEKAPFEVLGQLDRVDAVVPRVVELHGRVPGGPGCLLVGGKQRILERGQQLTGVDSLLALDLANGLHDLLAHQTPTLRRSDWPARSRRTVCRPARRSRSRAGTTARRLRRPGRARAARRS